MEYRVFAVLDSKLGVFTAVHVLAHEGQAVRAFTELVNDRNSQLAKWPEDYALYQIGWFSEESGELTSESKFIVNAVSVIDLSDYRDYARGENGAEER